MKKIFTLIALALGVIAIYSCEGDDPSPKPPVIVKPEPKPDPPKEPVLTITQVPEGQIAWGQSATITITSENAKFFWKGDSVTTATFELKYLLKDTTFSIEAKGYKSISKSHTIDVSTPTEYEKLIVGAWQLKSAKVYRPYDPNDFSKGHYWSEWEPWGLDNQECNQIEHYTASKFVRWEFPCERIIIGTVNIPPYEIGVDSVGRTTLEVGGKIATRDPSLINYPEVIVKLTKDTLIILQEIKPDAWSTGYRTFERLYTRDALVPYAFSEEEGGIAASRLRFVETKKIPTLYYKEGVGFVKE